MSDHNRFQQSFPLNSNKKEATISTGSFPNPNNNSLKEPIASTFSVIEVSSDNHETNSSMPRNKKPRSRRNNSSLNRVSRTNKGSFKSEPYSIPYSTRSQTRQQGLSTETTSPSMIMDPNATNESTGTNTEPATQPQILLAGRKRLCAKCKDSANIVKMINSKMSRIEELIKNLKKVTGEISNEFKNNGLTQTISSSSFGNMDLSKMSIDDIQKFVTFITNKFVTTPNKSTNSTEASIDSDILANKKSEN
ncbi:1957_t:CDS:2 [Funneliformis mosseae]|uniref:1957_t:CDS:1 n=1 Tax=Funneliformis mosseae TaxID=27381 RepID=A0A9N9EJP9_FUNMO|nr:1957_t:CDS:2 [Funneliformis mosseae]